MITKYCTGCRNTYSIDFYHKNKNRLDGVTHYCKSCTKVYVQRHRLKIKAEKKKLCPHTHKKCSICKIIKPRTEFYSNKSQSTKIYSSCISCLKAKLKYPKSSELEILYRTDDLLNERWVPIIINGITFPYEISDCGRIKLKNGNFAKPSFDQRGYPQIVLSLNSKRVGRRIHILVAEAFIGNPQNLREVNHEDGNKLYPHFSNLKYVTSLQNIHHAIKNNLRFSRHAKQA